MSSPILDPILSRRTLGRWLLGLALLAGLVLWVQHAVGWAELLAPWRDLPPGRLALLLALTATSYFLRAVRVYDYSRPVLRGAFPATLRLSLLHNTLNNFLPMRLGELAYPILMKRYFGQGYTASSVTLVWIRLLDLHFLGLPALVFLYVTQGAPGWLLLVPPWLALIPAMYWGHGLLQRRLVGYRGPLATLAARVLGHVPDSAGQFFRIWVWTALSWICKLLAFTAVVLHFADIGLGRAVSAGGMAYVSAVGPVDQESGQIPSTDIRSQARLCIANVSRRLAALDARVTVAVDSEETILAAARAGVMLRYAIGSLQLYAKSGFAHLPSEAFSAQQRQLIASAD